MIESDTGLPDDVLDELAALERAVVTHDGGRLKLEWSSLRAGHATDVIVRDGGSVIGFVGVYRHGGEPELAGMIHPDHRRQGLGAAALDRALELATDVPSVLLVVPRASLGGRRLALNRGGALDHSEHALRQRAAPEPDAEPTALRLRAATEADRGFVDTLMLAGFGFARGATESLGSTMIAELDGHPVSSLAVNRDGARAGVYGFVVETERRGHGIGRAVLGRVCCDLRAAGVEEVHLEVEIDNERALGLYTSLGFEPVTTEDYYRLSTNS